VSLICCSRTEREKARFDTAGCGLLPATRGSALVAGCAGGPARSSGEAPVMGVERRGRVIRGRDQESTLPVVGWGRSWR
jgi:hypothetical protein